MKRIGILTFHNAYNYGAVLQSLALLNALGNNASIINYSNDWFKKTNQYFIKDGNLIKTVLRRIHRLEYKKRTDRFNAFKEQFLTKAPLIDRIESDSADIFITGSDQVWNLDCTGDDDAYYLGFANGKKRASYAASFGKNVITQKEKNLILSSISEYDLISVREETGKHILSDLGIDNSEVVLDPTLLFKGEDWNKWFDLAVTPEEQYLLVYNVSGGSEIMKYAKIIAKSEKIKILYVTNSIKPEWNVKTVRDAGPIEWLKLIYNARYVVTNSYHGCIFSILFHKCFSVFIADNNVKNSTRTESLLDMLNLNKVIVKSGDTKYSINTIEYSDVDKILARERDKSYDFIRRVQLL